MGNIKLCDYGCGQEAKYQFKNGKWCCSKNYISCPSSRKKRKDMWQDPQSGYNSNSFREKQSNIAKQNREDPNSIYNSDSYKKNVSKGLKKAHKDPRSGFNSSLWKEKISDSLKESWEDLNSGYNSDLCKEKISNTVKGLWKDPNSKYNLYKLTIENITKKYPLFSKIEEMRYNPDKPDEKEIQVHCKNHNCKNSKEKGGWFTPTKNQFGDRKANLENEGIDNSNFYCCQECKDTCPLYRLHGDPYKNNNLPYTAAEYNTCRTIVLERENDLCEYCGEPATDMHHIFPVKLEPFFALDPDYCVACCEKCHYEKGHSKECSTGNLAKIVCSTESQKFLNQK